MVRYQKAQSKRTWWVTLLALLVVIGLGLLFRHYADQTPQWISQYAGDTLYGLMAFFLFAFFIRKKGGWLPALCALVFCFGIEFSQMYHAPWIDSIRATPIGALVLGFGFSEIDLICYTVGIALGFVIDLFYLLLRRYRAESGIERVCRSSWR